jgi:hypothetical protein
MDDATPEAAGDCRLPKGALQVVVGGRVVREGFSPFSKMFVPKVQPLSSDRQTLHNKCASFLAAGMLFSTFFSLL